MLAAGTLLTERLYLGVRIDAIAGESESQYQDANNGYFIFTLLQGRDAGCRILFGSRSTNLYGIYHGVQVSYYGVGSVQDQGRGEGYDGWRGNRNPDNGFYNLIIKDIATQIDAVCQVTLNTGGGGRVTYAGVDYFVNDTIMFDYSDLR